MLSRFQEHVASKGWFQPGDRVLVGYSGGPDSTCLLHLMHRAGFDVVAAHLHHGQRVEADTEAKLCEAFCGELGVPIVTGHADVPLMAEQQGMGLEEAGRHARYEFFRQAAFRLGCRWVATAHTRDDLVETVLLNLTRGSGLSGLSGIPEVRHTIVRPLLPFTREETRAYCLQGGLWTHDDPANADINFSRARLRHRVLPELRSINPEADAAVARLAVMASEEEAVLDGLAVHQLESAERPLNGKHQFLTKDLEAAFDREALARLPLAVSRRCLRLVAEALGGNYPFRSLQSAAESLGAGGTSWTSEGGKIVIEVGHELVHIRTLQVEEPYRFPLTVPGATDSDAFGWTLEAVAVEGWQGTFARDALDVVADLDKVKGALFLRSSEPGDRVAPMGFPHERKVSDLFAECGLTEAARRRLPIICDILGVVWVPGVCLADRVKPGVETSRGLRLRFGPSATGESLPS